MSDPIAAYNQIAPEFGRLSARRMLYLNRVDEIVISHIPAASRSLLDVGAGDGRRGLRIAQACGLTEVVLLEPSPEMQRRGSPPGKFLTLRAEQLASVQGSFDVITCLWNVLGHIFPHSARVEALRQFARLASPRGRIFIDVNHRYNAAHYGSLRTGIRFLYDRVRPREKNGDVVVTWKLAGKLCHAPGHVFTDREFRSLARAADVALEQRWIVDYATGQLRRYGLQGNLLYMLRPAAGAA